MEIRAIIRSNRGYDRDLLEGSTIIGIVSIGDLVRSIISLQDETIQYLQQYIGGHYRA